MYSIDDPAAPSEGGVDLLAAGAEFGLPVLDLSALDLAVIAEEMVDEEAVRRHDTLPLSKRGGRLHVAIADPANLSALDDLQFRTGLDVEPILVAPDKLADAIARCRAGGEDSLLTEAGDDAMAATVARADGDADVDETPIVKYVHELLLEAVAAGASDVHFEPYEKRYRIRLRIDGVLRESRRPPASLSARFAARLKVMAQLDIAERRVPQDGRIKLTTEGGAVDFRVSTLPTMHGEKVVLRILDRSAVRLGIDGLGFEDEQRERYRSALRRPQGMLLVTGPTGSGKTVTLYAGLSLLNAEERNIATAEDPVEINLEGINQVQVNPKVGLDFKTALRAFLRQDPDVVMVGEIRDLETAETAIKAAQTGHLVLSTLHTNSAAETLTRLRNMGVPAFNLATSVTLICAQRLVRLLCRNCKRSISVPTEALCAEGFTDADVATGFRVFDANPHGCGECRQGYGGRIGIHEVVEITPELQRLILRDDNSLALAEKARALGYDDLRRAGLTKAMRGLTSLAEVNRVTARY